MKEQHLMQGVLVLAVFGMMLFLYQLYRCQKDHQHTITRYQEELKITSKQRDLLIQEMKENLANAAKQNEDIRQHLQQNQTQNTKDSLAMDDDAVFELFKRQYRSR